MNDSTTGKPVKQKTGCFKIGCLGIILFVVFIVILGLLPVSVPIKGDTATLNDTLRSVATAQYEGHAMAILVYGVASEHPEIKKIVINCKLDVAGGAVDKYGKDVKSPLEMGSITIDDLDEVRKYKDSGYYAGENEVYYGMRIQNLNYSYLLSK